MKLEIKQLVDLKPLEKNIRLHPDTQIKEFVRSLNMYGQVRPMVVDEGGTILVGNGLYKALVQAGEKEGVVLVVSGMTEDEKTKLMIADNKVYELGIGVTSSLSDFLPSLRGEDGFNIPGYDESILQALYPELNDIRAEMVQPVVEPVRASGDEVKHTGSVKVDETGRGFLICDECGEKIWL